MESLLKVMAAKKRELSAIKTQKENRNEKYLRRAEVEELLFEKEKQSETQSKKRRLETPSSTVGDDQKASGEKDAVVEEDAESTLLPLADMKRRLRELGEPVTLFGESTRERMERLRRAEHDAASRREDELGEGHDIRNEFVGHRGGREGGGAADDGEDDDADDDAGQRPAERNASAGDGSAEDTGDEESLDDVMVVYRFFKGMLRRWEQDLANRPDHVKRTAQGKMATKTMKQCKDYIRPLFKLCKKRDVPSDILPSLVEIVRFCKEGEFVQANDAYIKLAIGNAAWPIGVTMVGIHERTGREKINANKQAHVMNNEAQRKYITSVKRLISYAQSVANVLPSKKVS